MSEMIIGNIKYTVNVKKRKKLKYPRIEVGLEKGINIIVPDSFENDKIKKIILDKKKWILTQIERFESIKGKIRNKELQDGSTLFYLGKEYILKICYLELKKKSIKVVGNYINVELPLSLKDQDNKALIYRLLKSWYGNKAKIQVIGRIKILNKNLDYNYDNIIIKDLQKRWGTCTKNDSLIFNWKIIMAPTSIADYIIIHELCHLKEKSHSTKFWNLLKSILPDYEERKEWLKIHGPTLIL